MFTIEQIQSAHSKVSSGADFPQYVHDLIGLGVKSYETHVSDGHTIYKGTDDFTTQSKAKYELIDISFTSNENQFEKDLKAHQQGKTDYPGFCNDCARSGVSKWVVDFDSMTCTYFGMNDEVIFTEPIPSL